MSRLLRWTLSVALTAALLSVSAAIPAWGQATNTGTVVGQVTDPQGAVVPGAKITLKDTATGNTLTTNSNDQGRYVIVNVPPATYDLTASKSGFATAKISGQAVQVGLTSTLDVKMAVGEISTTVEVQASNVELQTMNATVGNTVSGVALSSLPSLGRDVSTFVTLQPGVSPDGSVAGTVVDQSTFQLDGGNNTNDMDGSMSVYTPSYSGDPTGGVANQSAFVAAGPTGVMPTPADSVEEFKVNTANQTADFNSSSGAQVQVVTKRGTNAWHGTAYEYYLDNNFSANTWDNNFNGLKQPDYHYNRFGVAGGGPIIPKSILGGKTYFFANYQGFRWPNSLTFERAVPSANMRNGILTFGGVNYNLKALDPRGIGISPAVQQMWNQFEPAGNDPSCGALKGSRCDGVNEIGFKANVAIPQSDNFGVARLDHDFGSKWHFFGSYRYYRLTRATTSQIDIGGFFPGDTKGVPAAVSSRPQLPWYYVAGLTTNLTPTTTNDFHFSYLRNWWAWQDPGGVVQLSGLGGALEPFGESATTALVPYNVNTQSTRTRFWNGKDTMIRDDITTLKGNHLFSFGGTYQRNFNAHQRTDNGGGINYFPTYQLGDGSGAGPNNALTLSDMPAPAGVSATVWGRDVAAVLGLVTDSQIAFTRTGANLALNPPLTPAFDQSTIPYYNVYFSDSWHMKPSFTLTYGLGWTLEMPPVEKNGKQIELVDQANNLISVESYMDSRKQAALQGQVYNPIIGFTLVGNSENGRKYPYNPFYGSFSPRVAAAWNPDFGDGSVSKWLFGGGKSSVFRAGYGRVYGRLNGVNLVLVPLLGTGLIQAVQCNTTLRPGINGPGASCGPQVPTVSTMFRVGVDGNVAPLQAATPTLPQPDFPGINAASAGAGEALDPNFRPNVVDSFDLTWQRQLTRKITLELGYIGRFINHEYQPVNLNSVPYMMTLGGQSFAAAYANVEKALGCTTSAAACGTGNTANLAPQPFFEAALSGTGYCNNFANCTQAVVTKQAANFASQAVFSLWSALDKGGIGGGPNGTTVPGFNFARSMLNSPFASQAPCPGAPAGSGACGAQGQLTSGVGVNASTGYGNYNAGFVSVKMADWHGLTTQSNFTWSKALGTGALVQATSEYAVNDSYDIHNNYGLQGFDRTFVYNLFFVYQPPFWKGQQGLLGHVLGGWTFAPVFAAGSALPLPCQTLTGAFSNTGLPGAQEWGSADGTNFGTGANCIFTGSLPSAGVHVNNGGDLATGVGTNTVGSGSAAVNLYANPLAVYNLARPPILGFDKNVGGVSGVARGLPYWNVDLSIRKNIKITERVSGEFQTVFTNVLNHRIFGDPEPLDLQDPTSWGVLSFQQNSPRQMEFGFRISF